MDDEKENQDDEVEEIENDDSASSSDSFIDDSDNDADGDIPQPEASQCSLTSCYFSNGISAFIFFGFLGIILLFLKYRNP